MTCPTHETLHTQCLCPLPMGGEVLDELTDQVFEAQARLGTDATNFPRMPWPKLHELVGPIPPGTLLMAAARPGQGKTTFMLNVMDAFFEAGHRGWYMGLEQAPWELRTKWACLRLGIPQKVPMQGLWNEWPDGHRLRDLLRNELSTQYAKDRRDLIWFDSTTHVDRVGVERACRLAADRGMRYVVIDHIDRINHGIEGSFQQVSDTIRRCKELAVELELVVVAVSQMNREVMKGDKIALHFPPQPHHMRGAGTKEEESDIFLGVWRPLKVGITSEEIKQARAGTLSLGMIVEPYVMGVSCGKHRNDGASVGHECRLSLQAGKLHDALPDLPHSLR